VNSNGNKSDYTGGRTADTIVSWIKKKTGPPSELKSGADLKAMQGDIKKAIVYVGALEGELFEAHQAAAATGLGDAFQFLHTADADVASHFGLDGSGVVVIRNFDEALSAYSGAATKEALSAFAEGLQTPRLVNFDEDAIDPIFGKKNPAIILFSNESGKDYQEVFRKAADALAGKIIFVKSTTTEGIQSKLAEYVGVDASSAPCLRIIELGEDLVKYAYSKPIAEITGESIEAFIADFKAGNLKAHLKSEPVPESNDGPVKTLVGGNWNDIVADSSKDVLVKYYAPWCGHCKSLAPIWEDLGAHVADLDDVVIAKMDSTANEVPGVSIRSYPTLIYYPKDNKTGVKYEAGRDLDGFKAFLKENSSSYKAWADGAAAGAEAAAAHDEL
jgi:protein disulfide-isomerase A1